jgi:hypothetical protein
MSSQKVRLLLEIQLEWCVGEGMAKQEIQLDGRVNCV